MNGFLTLKTKSIGFQIAFLALYIELVAKTILIYLESFYGWDESILQFIFRYLIKVPVFIFLFLLFIHEILNKKTDRKMKIILGLLIILISLISLTIFKHWNEPLLHDFNKSNLFLTGHYGSFFLIGYFIFQSDFLIDKFKSIIILGQVLMTLLIIVFFNFSTLSIDIVNLQHNNYIHLFLGTNYAIWSIFTISVLQKGFKIYGYLICLLFLFFLSSRAAFYCFSFLAPVILYLTNNKLIKYLFIVFGFFILLLVINPFSLLDHRMFAVFSGSDLSLQYRIATFQTTFNDFHKNFIFGDYGGFYSYLPPTNTYLHNILSFWSQFGLLPFLVIILLCSMVVKEVYINWTNIGESKILLGTLLSVFILTSVLIAQSYKYPILFILLGFLSLKQVQKKSKSRQNLGKH